MNKVNLVADKVHHHLETIYKDLSLTVELSDISADLLKRMRISNEHDIHTPKPHSNLWTEKDIVLIAYGDSIIEPSSELSEGMRKPPLQTLHAFLQKYCSHAINHVHILPFFPYSSDDGFSVIDYSAVNQALGSWDDVTKIANEFGLMVDLVVNHCSSRSLW
ncbi:MAG: sucrose phosphorylase, partial [Glaciecola sp.]